MNRFAKTLVLLAAALLLLGVGPSRARADLIQTGGFEDPSPTGTWALFDSGSLAGWDSGNLLELQTAALFGPAAEGNQYMEMDSNRGDGNQFLTQSFATTLGASYSLRFAFSARPGHGQNILEVGIGGADAFDIFQGVVASASGSGLAQTAWTYYTLDFVATGGLTRIGFRDAGSDDSLGTLLDDVSVSGGAAASTPEPGTLILVASSLGGLAAWRRRRKRVSARA